VLAQNQRKSTKIFEDEDDPMKDVFKDVTQELGNLKMII
jgi:hypothetical protein